MSTQFLSCRGLIAGPSLAQLNASGTSADTTGGPARSAPTPMATVTETPELEQLFARGRERAQLRADGRERLVEARRGRRLPRRRPRDGRCSCPPPARSTSPTLADPRRRLRRRLPGQVRHRRRLHGPDRARPRADALPPPDPGGAAGRQRQLGARPADRLRDRRDQRPPRLPRLRRLLALGRPGRWS